jgi:hypothetical protein
MLLKYGSKGDDVRQLQKWLGITADGIFGAQTRKAVKAFQAAHGLEVDGIVGDQTWGKLLELHGQEEKPPGDPASVDPTVETFVQPVDYKQYDKRWASLPYTATGNPKQTVKSSGCGVVSVCDVLATLVSPKITPLSIVPMFVEHGFRTRNTGTAWAAFKWTAEKFGLKFLQTSSLAKAEKWMQNGGYCVCSMKAGYWTTGGHYICAWRYDDKYMYANDPASATRKRQKLADFKAECRQYFCFMK